MSYDPILFVQDLAVILGSAALCAFLCSKVGLSPVVGYLVAGLIVGTPEIVFPYVSDRGRIEVIAQLGVVFLMFSIGLQFRLQRIRELGWRLAVATFTTSLIVLTAVRFVGDILGLPASMSVALAAIFMVSSSAIIAKVLQEKGMGHDRHGQLALGVTLMEDIVAVVMLTIIGSLLAVDGSTEATAPLQTVLLLIGFASLVFIIGLLVIPRVLNASSSVERSETISVFVAAVLLILGLVAVRAGYSLALGAFICGMIVAESRQKAVVERMFRGIKDIFLTVFFVTIGMMIDLAAIPGVLHWIVLGTLGAVFGRGLAAFFSLLLVGEHPRTALRAAVCLTPLGEFSFIIAGFVVAGGLFPEKFQVIAVGVALLTSIIFPLLATHGERLTRFLAEGESPKIEKWHEAYASFWRGLLAGGNKSVLWKLLRKRIIQVAVELLLLSTILIFSRSIYQHWQKMVGGDHLQVFFWVLVGLACLIPLVAVWRNLSAVALILADYSKKLRKHNRGSPRVSVILLNTLFGLLLILWLWNFLPADLPRLLLVFLLGLFAAVLVPFGWRRMVLWHSEIEWTIDQSLRGSTGSTERRLFETWQAEGWNLEVQDLVLPDDTAFHGKPLKEVALRTLTGCSIVGIERHGQGLSGLGPDTHLFAGDQLLLLGTRDQMKRAQELFAKEIDRANEIGELNRNLLETLRVKESPIVGQTLAQLNWARLFGVQVVAIRREGENLTALDGSTRIEAGDVLLLLGSASSIGQLADSLG